MGKEVTADELAAWGLEVNNALMNASEVVTFSEARIVIQGATEAFRQLVLELFIIHDMPAGDWFSDGYRARWASQIRSAYEQWLKDKANGSRS